MRRGGQYVKNAFPMIHFLGIGPHSRLSALCPRLSPIIKKCPGGMVMSVRKLQMGQVASGRMYGSFRGLSLMYTPPRTTFRRSPGSPTTRLMKLLFDFWGVGFSHARPPG